MPPGRTKPTATREHIAQRHDFCEDLAQLLAESTATRRWQLGITTADALERVRRGLQAMDGDASEAERDWVLQRVAELLPRHGG